MEIRTLTVYRKYVERFIKGFIPVPEIRLMGKWMEKIGFKYGNKVAVIYQKDKVIIINTENKVIIL